MNTELLLEGAVDLEQAKLACPIRFQGKFEEIINGVNEGKIVLVKYLGHIVGMNYLSGLDTLNDNLASIEFKKAFSELPVMQYVLLATYLKVNSLLVDEVLHNEYVVICSKGQVLDLDGDVVVSTNVEGRQKEDILNDLKQLFANRFGEDEDMDEDEEDEVEEQDEPENSTPRTHFNLEEEVDSEDNITLPNKQMIGVEAIGCLTDKQLETTVKNYLRNRYKHYLAKDVVLQIKRCDGYAEVKNIQWGRKMY